VTITFRKLARGEYIPTQSCNVAYLQPDNWDDFGYKTLFSLEIFDGQGQRQSIGSVKIGLMGQVDGWTEKEIPTQFNTLNDNFYSLGQDAEYYKNIVEKFPNEIAFYVLTALGDVAYDFKRLASVRKESAFNTSLLRNVNYSTIVQQFKRILNHEAELTKYDFFYEKAANDNYSGIKVEFKVEPNAKPSSNIHILIGRNGVGKTTLLNNMVDALLPNRGEESDTGFFAIRSPKGVDEPLNEHYFAGVVSVSFSAFDPFSPPDDQSNANKGMRYYYVGLKKRKDQQVSVQGSIKNTDELSSDFISSIKLCFSLTAKRDRWLNSIRVLESDSNFEAMNLSQLINFYTNDFTDEKLYFTKQAYFLFKKMSSGHAIVLLSITKLVETVEEKTLVLLDEPESHLHPPLLSAFTRALSNLLVNRNGVAIIATHSPVVLQEVPKSCVTILRRNRLFLNVDRPESETFAENVGVLTREVFGLEVTKSGFHNLLANSVEQGKSYEEIEEEYQYQLGFEGQAILRSMILYRDSQEGAKR